VKGVSPNLIIEKFDAPIKTTRAPYSYAPLPRDVYCRMCDKHAYYKVTRKMEFIDTIEYYCKSCFKRLER
jgi:hypothetical protein